MTNSTQSIVSSFESFSDIRKFGAVLDGVTDDTAAWQAALDSSELIFFPKGKSVVSATLQFPDKTKIVGASCGDSEIYFTGMGALFEAKERTKRTYYHRFENFSVRRTGAATPNATIAFDLYNCALSSFSNLNISSFNEGFRVDGYKDPNNSSNNVYAVANRFYNIIITTCSTFMSFRSGSNENTVLACRFTNASGDGIYIENTNKINITNSILQLVQGHGIRINATSPAAADSTNISFNRFEKCGYDELTNTYPNCNVYVENSNVRFTTIVNNAELNGQMEDNGDRTVLECASYEKKTSKKSDGIVFDWSRDAFSTDPLVRFSDLLSSRGNQTTMQLVNNRGSVGTFLSMVSNDNEKMAFPTDGSILFYKQPSPMIPDSTEKGKLFYTEDGKLAVISRSAANTTEEKVVLYRGEDNQTFSTATFHKDIDGSPVTAAIPAGYIPVKILIETASPLTNVRLSIHLKENEVVTKIYDFAPIASLPKGIVIKSFPDLPTTTGQFQIKIYATGNINSSITWKIFYENAHFS